MAKQLTQIHIHTQYAHRRPKKVYRRLWRTEVLDRAREHGLYTSKGKPTHRAWIQYDKKRLAVYLIDNEWHCYPFGDPYAEE